MTCTYTGASGVVFARCKATWVQSGLRWDITFSFSRDTLDRYPHNPAGEVCVNGCFIIISLSCTSQQEENGTGIAEILKLQTKKSVVVWTHIAASGW